MPDTLRLVMLGTGTFAEPTLRAIVAQVRHPVVGLVTQPDRERGAKTGSTRQVGEGMKAIAEAAGVPVYQPESINTAEGVEQLKAWRPDLLVTAAYGQILKAEVLDAARLGGINVHASLLPKYRGAAPIAWAIDRGESETGVTIIRMTTGLDAGEMLLQKSVAIGPHETAGDLEARLAPLGAQMAVDIVEALAAGPISGMAQDPALVTKAPKLKKEDGAIDWTQSAEAIARRIRAMQPWPTAYTFLKRLGQIPARLILLKSEVAPGDFGPPGVTRPSTDGKAVDVATGEGVLRVLELQPAGKKRMPAAAFLAGRSLLAGDTFGCES